MALNDNAVITAGQGFVFINTVGAVAPTAAELDTIDPETFGCQVLTLTATGAPDSYTLTVGAGTTPTLDDTASAAQVQAALEALTTVGSGNVIVEGVSLVDAEGLKVTVVGAKAGQTLTITGTGTGGSSPTIDVEVTTAPNGWRQIGHTSRDDMPEFGFDGGDTEVKGTWQKKRLREVATGDPVADFVTMNIQQWDALTLELYFGANVSGTPGEFAVSGDFVPVEYSFLVIIVDGEARIGFHSAKASFKRDDSIDMPVDEFSSLPVRATFLNHLNLPLYKWISHLFA